jgi:protein-L-isoaspartate(D-aspartate) O-methyltransferase
MTSDSSPTDFAAMRTAMIESQLRPQGIADPLVLSAMSAVPREAFVAQGAEALAYGDRGAPKRGGGTMTPPSAFAALLQALEPVPGERALVIGDPSGYAATVLEALGVDAGDGGNATDKVDLILVDGAVEHLPDDLVARLKPGGRLAAGIIDDGVTRLVIGRHSGGAFGLATIGDAYVPRLAGFERPRAFVF